MATTLLKPDYLFEVSWEVCNKVGGIHTVIATKAKTLGDVYGDHYILVGPDVWKGGDNSEFIEDPAIFKSWKERAIQEGLKIRIGRWKILGNPIVILVDFTPFFTQKNEIFTDLWIKFQLDSLTGGWDYIEPALFGYATAKVIECFYRHHLNTNDKIIAQFHEWMTGAGILYLKEYVPQAATVFTTHATVLGRAIAGSGVSFYSLFDSFIAEKAANDFNVVAKHSLEKVTANTADCFTTVSDITARECEKFLGNKPDIITHNGFDTSILPADEQFDKKRRRARKKVIGVAEALLNQELADDSLLVIKSGRYEYRNKGIDIFIDSLAELKTSKTLNKTVLGIIFVPAHQTGPRKELLDRISAPDFSNPNTDEFLTHYLQGSETDPILKEIERVKLHNQEDDKVKIIFVPTYLDGNDGIFNLHYYDVLIGFDLAIFPSYYEPWGYTPLESIAYHIPSVTTNISGFGMMITELFNGSRPGISVVARTDYNEKDVVSEIARIILNFSKKDEEEITDAKGDAYCVAQSFLWDKLIANYENAYDLALGKAREREALFHFKPQVEPITLTEIVPETSPVWRKITVEAEFPRELGALQKLSRNLWWCWNYEAEELYEYIDAELWTKCRRNPVLFLRKLTFKKIEDLTKDKTFLKSLKTVEKKFDEYISTPVTGTPKVAYFSMEYGFCSFIKLYSGGLGILAGDYLKQASDDRVDITAVGLLYKNGYFKQKFSIHGEQLAEPESQDFTSLPIQLITNNDHSPLTINLFFPGRTVIAQVWRMDVGRVALYLLDTDVPENSEEDRKITSFLYNANIETRLEQEILLGIGGIRALNALGIKADVFHCNEGHAAFINIERIQNLVKQQNLSFDEALEIARSSTLFTTHTSVPAANDMFSEDLLRKYLADNTRIFNIDWNRFMGLGRLDAMNNDEKFSMTYFAAKLSQEINAVSRLHRKVSRTLLNPLWKNFSPGELYNIDSVTNGVHYPTWASKEWQQLFNSALQVSAENISDKVRWEKIKDVSAGQIWNIHSKMKDKLVDAIKTNLERDATIKNTIPNKFHAINRNALFVGFARRFVVYKRPALLLTDVERLARIISDNDKPVLFLFAGKAHPMDYESIRIINQLINATGNPAFKNSIMFLEDYDMEVARYLVQGVDLWLNTPYRHTEASGTSGMKATINGVLNFSVSDGWWSEGYDGSYGWRLSEEPVYNDNEMQNQLDAETIYNTLENDIIPTFFERDKDNIPVRWIEKIKASLLNLSPQFMMQRVLKEYKHNFYDKLYERSVKLRESNNAIAKGIVAWKKKILTNWNEVDVISIEIPVKEKFKSTLGEEFKIKIVLDIGRLAAEDVGVEIIITGKTLDEDAFVKEFSVSGQKGAEVTYECTIRTERTGAFDFAFRIFPKNINLPHRQDFDLIKYV
jgi:glycogen phosphorylase/synthase